MTCSIREWFCGSRRYRICLRNRIATPPPLLSLSLRSTLNPRRVSRSLAVSLVSVIIQMSIFNLKRKLISSPTLRLTPLAFHSTKVNLWRQAYGWQYIAEKMPAYVEKFDWCFGSFKQSYIGIECFKHYVKIDQRIDSLPLTLQGIERFHRTS